MDAYELEKVSSYKSIHDLVIKYNEPCLIEGQTENNTIVLPENHYIRLLEKIAKLDTSLQGEVMLAIGAHASGWDDDTVNSKEVAASLCISVELFLQVCYQIEDGTTVFRALDDECCLLSPYGWERYEVLLKEYYQDELYELAHPKLIYDECGDPVLATTDGLYACKTLNGIIQEFDTLYDQLNAGQDIQGDQIQSWETMSLGELSHYHGEIE